MTVTKDKQTKVSTSYIDSIYPVEINYLITTTLT